MMTTKFGMWTMAGVLFAATPVFGAAGDGQGVSSSDPSTAALAPGGEAADVLSQGRGDATAVERDEISVHARAPRARSDRAADSGKRHRIAAPASGEPELSDEFLMQQRSWTGP
jgi:hypothetical protein